MKAKKIRDIHILFRNGRWAAVWQGEICRIQNDKRRRARVVRHADSPEHALVSLLASEILEPQKRGYMLAHAEFIVWLEQNGLMSLRRALLFAKGDGWTNLTKPEAIRVYRKWRREQTSGTSLGLEE